MSCSRDYWGLCRLLGGDGCPDRGESHLRGTALHGFPGHPAHRGAPMSHSNVISVGPLPSVSTGLGSPSSLCPWCPVERGAGRRPRQLLLNQHMFGGSCGRRVCAPWGSSGERGWVSSFLNTPGTPRRAVSSPLQGSLGICPPDRCRSSPLAAPRGHTAPGHPAAGTCLPLCHTGGT